MHTELSGIPSGSPTIPATNRPQSTPTSWPLNSLIPPSALATVAPAFRQVPVGPHLDSGRHDPRCSSKLEPWAPHAGHGRGHDSGWMGWLVHWLACSVCQASQAGAIRKCRARLACRARWILRCRPMSMPGTLGGNARGHARQAPPFSGERCETGLLASMPASMPTSRTGTPSMPSMPDMECWGKSACPWRHAGSAHHTPHSSPPTSMPSIPNPSLPI